MEPLTEVTQFIDCDQFKWGFLYFLAEMVSLELDHGLGSTTVLSRAWAMCPIVFLELDLIVRLTYKAIWEQPLGQAQKPQKKSRFFM